MWSRWLYFKVKEEIFFWIVRWCCFNFRDSGCKCWGVGVDWFVVYWFFLLVSVVFLCWNRCVEVCGYGGVCGMFDMILW